MWRHSGRRRRLFLADHDRQHALERVQAAFPSFTQWTYTNVSEDERLLDGCSLWGQWVLRRAWRGTSPSRLRRMPSTGGALSRLASIFICGRAPT
jgi:hypothetical protein